MNVEQQKEMYAEMVEPMEKALKKFFPNSTVNVRVGKLLGPALLIDWTLQDTYEHKIIQNDPAYHGGFVSWYPERPNELHLSFEGALSCKPKISYLFCSREYVRKPKQVVKGTKKLTMQENAVKQIDSYMNRFKAMFEEQRDNSNIKDQHTIDPKFLVTA